MNKQKLLMKRISIELGIAVAVLVASAGVMLVTSTLVEASVTAKSKADTATTQQMAQVAAMQSQLDKSGEAEKRFVEIQLNRSNANFTSSTDGLREWARNAKDKYRFANNFKLNVPPPAPSTKSELVGLEFDVTERKPVDVEMEAMSDMHVFSFLDELRRSPPGLTRVTYLSIERKADMDPQVLAQMLGGVAPPLVAAHIQFDWVGINPKGSTGQGAAGGAAGTPPPGFPMMGGPMAPMGRP